GLDFLVFLVSLTCLAGFYLSSSTSVFVMYSSLSMILLDYSVSYVICSSPTVCFDLENSFS
ncbi:hypothetical protein NAI77_09685, partial [Francisella tularensis subsp. holarctica]|uniref:hypothetical protein n=1 Tax=Francisella tularensis TaxID=263 RepID=UPI002381B8BE